MIRSSTRASSSEHFEADPNLTLAACSYWIRKLQACVFARRLLRQLSRRRPRRKPSSGLPPHSSSRPSTTSTRALARAGSDDTVDAVRPDQQMAHLEALTAHHQQLQIWAEHCPENFENRAALVGAEIARLEGRDLDAERLYEQAIRSARANGFVHNEALACETAARFYAARGFEDIAEMYLRKSPRRLPALGRRWQGAATRGPLSATGDDRSARRDERGRRRRINSSTSPPSSRRHRRCPARCCCRS